jgi:hypothetical protein
MLIGDSFFYGSFIEDRERLGAQLEALAAADPAARRPLKVYNFARSGYSTVQELIVAQTYAPQVDPDAIVLGVFASNDLIANALTRVDDQGNFVPVPEQIAKFRTAIRTTLGPWRHSILGRIAALTTPMGTRIYYQIAQQPWVIERNEQVLDQVRDYCRQHDYRFGVVFQHTRDSLNTGTFARAFYQNAAVHDALDRHCEQAGIDFIDIRAVFHAAGDWQSLIHERPDSHFNARGTHKTAEAIYQRMIRPELLAVPKVNAPQTIRNHP